jgi:hypothetical protein
MVPRAIGSLSNPKVFRVEEGTAGSANQATRGKLAVLDPSVHSPNGNVKEVCDLTDVKERCHLDTRST